MNYYGTILRFNNQPDDVGDVFAPTTGCTFPSSIPIYNTFDCSAESRQWLGYAILTKKPRSLFARMKIDDAITNTLISKGVKLYPAVGGKVIGRCGKRITSCSVEHMIISVDSNADKTIKPLRKR